MSHYTPQRARLVETLVQSAKPGGWIFIGEETEGYAPLEIENAIRDQDSRSLRARLRQILNGILGLPEFRFFVSGNLEPLLFACGAEATWSDTTEWMGLPYFQRTLARRANQTMVAEAIQGDYTELPGEIGRLQEICKPVLGRPLTRDERLRLSDFAESEGRLAPFAIFVLMIEAIDPRLSSRASLIEKIRSRGPTRLKGAQPDWEHVEELFTRFRDLVAARHHAGIPLQN